MTARSATTNWVEWPAWLDDATDTPACRGKDTNLFFPIAGQASRAARAKAICAACPLLDPCRDWAMRQKPATLAGIWGGTSETERRALYTAATR